MIPAKRSFEVLAAVKGPLRVHVVDATNDVRGFEFKTTGAICEALGKTGVPLTGTSPHLCKTIDDFARAFDVKEDWNTLLIVSHGARSAVPGAPDKLRIGDVRTHWYLANGIDLKVEDKLVFLCVCEGACEDALYVLLRDQLALMLGAPMKKLSRSEAFAFFPAALAELCAIAKAQEVTPEIFRDVVENHAAKANNKMAVFSAVGFVD